MRQKNVLLCLLYVVSSLYVKAQNQINTYISVVIPRSEMKEISYIGTPEYDVRTTYFDGLARPTGIVRRGISPTNKDLFTFIEYDSYGRQSKEWLFAAYNGNGTLPNLSTGKDLICLFNQDNYPYSLTKYDNSPIGKTSMKLKPGSDWHSNNKGIITEYLSNSSTDYKLRCRKSIYDGKITYFSDGALSVTKTIDEEGNENYVFVDWDGKTLLIRSIVQDVLFDTYYEYDLFQNLIKVLPPMIGDNMSQETMDRFAYIYSYDDRKRCISKKMPGCAPVKYVYDNANRVVFTQTGKQRTLNEWTFIFYDVFGRETVQGVCESGKLPDVGSQIVTTKYIGSEPAAILGSGYQLSDGVNIDVSYRQLLQANYYDHYDFIDLVSDATIQMALKYQLDSDINVNDYGVRYTSSKGLLTGKQIAQLPTGNHLFTALYYDEKKNVVQTRKNNILGGIDKEYYAYLFTGELSRHYHCHSIAHSLNEIRLLYKYEYDHAGRLTQVTHQLNGGTIVTLAQNTYDELGRLVSSIPNNLAKLKTNRTYNVRSWLQNISNDIFSENLTFDYNGNIRTQEWMQNNQSRTYSYSYDNLSRLIKADYSDSSKPNADYSVNYTYDKHGNVETLNRYGRTGTTTFGAVDSLQLVYKGNQLMNVADKAMNPTLSPSADFKDGSDLSIEYNYDENGNLTQDKNKGISEIQYNVLNLPTKLTISKTVDQVTNSYRYGADGQKYSVIMERNGSNLKRMDYVDNIIYEDGVLKRILFEGGYIEGGMYYFYVQDHLGSNRIVAKADGTVVQTNHYYPYGMSFAEGVQASSQPYKYNNKELDNEHGLNLYDYVARGMDPVFGRFTGIDPMAEKYYFVSPYVYCVNNPINCVDLDGRDWYRIKDDNGEWKYRYNDKIHSQKELDKSISHGEYLGQVYTNNNIYYSLFGSQVTADSFEGAIYKLVDTAIIKETNAKLEEYGYSGGEDLVRSPVTDFSIRGVNAKDSKYLGLDSHRNEYNIKYENSSNGLYIVYEDKTRMRGEMTDWIGYPDQPKVIHGYFAGDSKPMYHIRFINKSHIEGDIIHLEYNAPAAKIILAKYYNLFPKLRK